MTMFASRPTGIVKCSKNTDNKFGYINSHNASGQLPVIQPVPTPDPEPTPPAETAPLAETTPPADKPCTPRPACLDSTPPCSPAVPAGGYCKPEAKKDTDDSTTQHLIMYGIGGVIGGGLGYLIAEKKIKNIYGGMLIGAGVIAGGVYLYFNGKELVDKFKNRGRVGSDETKGSSTGERTMPSSGARQKSRKCRRLNPDGTTTVYECPEAL
jgi:hypothetical protein